MWQNGHVQSVSLQLACAVGAVTTGARISDSARTAAVATFLSSPPLETVAVTTAFGSWCDEVLISGSSWVGPC
jgi:hypothetical protein